MSVHGIDVASFQRTDYSTAGLVFVMVKATQSTTYVNPHNVGQVDTARRAGLVVGHYHFLVAGHVQEQANFFVKHAPWREGDLLACDWETPPKGTGTAASDAEKNAFLTAVAQLRPHARVLLYCNTDFWLHRDQHGRAGDGLWIADPDHAAGHPRITHPHVIHQYGITGGTDQNLAAFPDKAAMAAWAAGKGKTPPVASGGTAIPHAPAPTIEQRVTSLESRVTTLEHKGA